MKPEDISYYSWYLDPLPPGINVWPEMVGDLKGHGRTHKKVLHTFTRVHFIIRGSGIVRSPSGEYVVQAGDIFSIWPGVQHEFKENPEIPRELYWLQLQGPESRLLCEQWGFGPDHPVYRSPAPKAAFRAFRSMFMYWGHEDRDPYEGLVLFYHLIASTKPRKTIPKKKQFSSSAIVDEARIILESLIDTGVNVNDIAESMRINRTSLWNAIKIETGLTAIEWIQNARIERAKELLLETNLKLATIAAMCGFNGEKYFMYNFRKNVGMTPGQWREHKE